ncbi:MAG: hypothetical protein IJG45_00420 [Oscillospiraceae bacterium]|nr:hypothetical protein [Oscillospiraceae bacterium]
MKRIVFILVVVILLFCACKSEALDDNTIDNTPAERLITSYTDILTDPESRALNDFLYSTRIYLSGKATLKTPSKWSCRLNERCLIAIAQWKLADENGLQPVLLYEEDGQIHATELGRNVQPLLTTTPDWCSSPINLSFVQQVGNTTVICIGSDDLLMNKITEMPYDNCATVPLRIADETKNTSAFQDIWIMSVTDSSSQDIYSSQALLSGDCGHLFVIEDMEDTYTLYVGGEALTGAYLKSLLSDT